MSEKKSLVEIVKRSESEHSGSVMLGVLEFVGVGACYFNPLIGFALAVSASAAQAYEKKQSLEETRMPDEWLVGVSASEGVSKDGISHLAKCIDKKGYVSVNDALKWVEIEKSFDDKIEKKKSIEVAKSESGARMIMDRAVNECGFLFGRKTIQAGREFLAEGLDSMSEKAGKKISEAASFIKNQSTKK